MATGTWSGPTRLGFCLMLKFFEIEGRFPEFIEEFPQPAVQYVAGLVKVPAAELAKYDLAGAKRHRKQIREALGFRPSTVADEERLAEWLSTQVCPVELVEDRQREALLVQCRVERIEPPGRTRVEKVLVAARNRWERAFCTRTIERLGDVGTARLLALVAEGSEDGAALLAALKRDPGAVGLDLLLAEITKLNDVRRLCLPEGLFVDCSEKMVAAWRARAIKMYPSDFRDTAEDVRITLLAALCSSRQAEITDALVELLVALVHKINARAERRVERQLTAELKKVRGKEGILFKLADAAIGKPDEVVRTALYPVVGEKTLRDLVAEAKANEKVFKAKVRTTLRSSYSSYYRQMLPPLLRTLGFRYNNTAYRPVMGAMKLLEKYAEVDGKTPRRQRCTWLRGRLRLLGVQLCQESRLARSVQPGVEVHEAGEGLAYGCEVDVVEGFVRPGHHLRDLGGVLPQHPERNLCAGDGAVGGLAQRVGDLWGRQPVTGDLHCPAHVGVRIREGQRGEGTDIVDGDELHDHFVVPGHVE
ncbi:DUF4158 domain-containing protein [Streptomyces sp. NBC_01483]|nr:DUF4158 domain-containing protein [Streptomyces sp. NBC_01483]